MRYYTNYLEHHGIKGQKWGIRRFQNKDGTRTVAGKARQNNNKDAADSEPEKSGIGKYKKLIIAGIVVGGVAAGVTVAYKKGLFDNIGLYMGSEGSKDYLDEGILEKAKNKTIESVDSALDSIDYHDALYKSLDDEEFTLEPGTTIRRVVGKSGFDPSKEHGALYTSFTRKDARKYRNELKDWNKTGKRYEVTMKLQKQLKIPSKATAEEIYNGLYQNDPKFRNDVKKSLYKAYYGLVKEANPKATENQINTFVKNEITKQLSEENGAFKAGMYALVKQGADSKKYYKELQKKGYNALIDYEDRDANKEFGVSSPLILLDNSALVKVGEKFIGRMFY